jgi:maleylacetate reductase
MRRIARALAADDAAGALFDLAVAIGARTALKDIGMQAEDLDRAAEIATRNPYDNPAPVTRAGVRKLLDAAYHGRRPGEKGKR